MYEIKDEFKTGIGFIDEQHAMLFKIANETYNLLKNDYTVDKYDKIVALLEKLKEYTIFHFNSEEAYMEKIGYKRMFTQKMDHEAFKQKLNEMDLSKIDSNQDKYILDILGFLNDWLVEHISEKDCLIGK